MKIRFKPPFSRSISLSTTMMNAGSYSFRSPFRSPPFRSLFYFFFSLVEEERWNGTWCIYIYGWGGNFRFEGLTRVWTRFEYRSVTFYEICRDKVIFSVCNLDIRLRYVEKREELSRILISLLKKKYFLFVTIFIRNWYEYNVIYIYILTVDKIKRLLDMLHDSSLYYDYIRVYSCLTKLLVTTYRIHSVVREIWSRNWFN